MGDDLARLVVHWEIEVVDAEAQRAFYASLFDWEIRDGPVMQIPAGIGDPSPGVAPTSARVIAAG
jgi:predicted enzyme related to lactoylglutathione lyase